LSSSTTKPFLQAKVFEPSLHDCSLAERPMTPRSFHF
jgi:hypothetical protein